LIVAARYCEVLQAIAEKLERWRGGELLGSAGYVVNELTQLAELRSKVDGTVTATFIGGDCEPVMSGWIDLRQSF
jgi:hypothetical protein